MAAANLNRIVTRRLGSAGPAVYPIALGCMAMSGMYGDADENESIAPVAGSRYDANQMRMLDSER